MNRSLIAIIAIVCMALVALAVAATPTATSTPTGSATASEHQFHPFSGTPAAVPGTIQAEDYDKGGQGFAWFDRTPGNQGGAYREDDVDIESGGSGNVVAFVKSSEWLIYSVHVPENGMYRATFRASSPWDGREIWVWVDGILEAQVKVKNTGSFDSYEDVSADVALPVGNHYIRLEFVKDAQNLDFMTLERVGSIPTWPFFGTGTSGQGTGTVTPTASPTATTTSGQGGAGGGTVTPTPTETGTVTPTASVTVTPTVTSGGGGSNVTPTPTETGNVTPTTTVTGTVTPTPTSGGGSGGSGTGNVTPTQTPASTSDLTNANSPLAAFFQNNLSFTRLNQNASFKPVVNLQLVTENLTRPVMLASPGDGSARLFVVEQTGTVEIIKNGTMTDGTFLDVRDRMVALDPFYDERGLLSIAFHPNFSTNGKVYAFYSAPLRSGAPANWSCTNRLSEFTVANGSDRVDMNSERILMEIDKPQMNHNGGQIEFDPADGFLYVPLGDGGGANDVGEGHTPGIGNAQDLSKIYGKILRIDVNNVTGPQWNATNATWTSGAGTLYGIPTDNPFLGNSSIPPEIFAYGFRNPAFTSFDSGGNHAMFIAMAGQELFESVLNIYKGGNYGWHLREGTHCFDPANNRTPPATCPITGLNGTRLIGPIVEGGHDIGAVIVGGQVYRGSAMAGLEGQYVFGYYSTNPATGNGTLLVATPPSGHVSKGTDQNASSLTSADNAMWSVTEVAIGSSPNGRLNEFLYGIGRDESGELYALTSGAGGTNATLTTGKVWKILPGTAEALNLSEATINKTIPEVAAGAEGHFSTLLTAVTAANLTSTLGGPGPFTVFAPLNPAFDNLPPGLLDMLLMDPNGLLKNVLTYHVVPGRYTLADLAAMQSLKTVEGENVSVVFKGNHVEVGGAPIIFPNIEAKNGIIHAINGVMVPPSVMSNLTNQTANVTPTVTTATPTMTATPTVTPTPNSGSGDTLAVTGLNLQDEWVSVRNTGGAPVQMQGYTISDRTISGADIHVYTFPSFELPAGATVTVHTGSGADTATDLYWGLGSSVWNNDGDTATLKRADGTVISSLQQP